MAQTTTEPRTLVNFEPLHDRVLLKPIETVQTHVGTIEIPDSQREKPLEGVVIAVGPGRADFGRWVTPCCALGDTVLYGKYAGVDVMVDGIEYLLVRDEELLGRRPSAGSKEA